MRPMRRTQRKRCSWGLATVATVTHEDAAAFWLFNAACLGGKSDRPRRLATSKISPRHQHARCRGACLKNRFVLSLGLLPLLGFQIYRPLMRRQRIANRLSEVNKELSIQFLLSQYKGVDGAGSFSEFGRCCVLSACRPNIRHQPKVALALFARFATRRADLWHRADPRC